MCGYMSYIHLYSFQQYLLDRSRLAGVSSDKFVMRYFDIPQFGLLLFPHVGLSLVQCMLSVYRIVHSASESKVG
jgi:hypothetical protein